MSFLSAIIQRLTGSLDTTYPEMTGQVQASRPSVNISYIA